MDNLIPDDEETNAIDIIPSGNPVVGEVIDTDEDPFTVIKSQSLQVRINTDNPINMNTFASGSDSRWSVHNYLSPDKTLFKGFLILDDMNEDFMPDPNIVLLTGTDGLALLKEIPFVDFDGNNPVGEYTLAELLAMALYRTGTPLQMNVAFNIKKSGAITDIRIPGSGSQHFFSTVYLNAKTFEDEIGTCISCYDVIKYILGDEAHVFQRNG